MIVRVSEAFLREGSERGFLARLTDLVSSFPATYPEMVWHEILVDAADPRRVQYASAWPDEAALVRYAGDRWRSSPVTFPDEERFLTRPLELRHFVSVAGDMDRPSSSA